MHVRRLYGLMLLNIFTVGQLFGVSATEEALEGLMAG
jgi:hypothetical protein